MAHHIVSTGMQRSTHTAGCGYSSDLLSPKSISIKRKSLNPHGTTSLCSGSPRGSIGQKTRGAQTEKSNQYAKSIAPTAPGDLYAARVCMEEQIQKGYPETLQLHPSCPPIPNFRLPTAGFPWTRFFACEPPRPVCRLLSINAGNLLAHASKRTHGNESHCQTRVELPLFYRFCFAFASCACCVLMKTVEKFAHSIRKLLQGPARVSEWA